MSEEKAQSSLKHQDSHEDDAKETSSSPRVQVPNDVPHSAKILEVTNTDLALALSTGPPLNPGSWTSIKLYLCLVVAFMGSMANGFDGQGAALYNRSAFRFSSRGPIRSHERC